MFLKDWMIKYDNFITVATYVWGSINIDEMRKNLIMYEQCLDHTNSATSIMHQALATTIHSSSSPKANFGVSHGENTNNSTLYHQQIWQLS